MADKDALNGSRWFGGRHPSQLTSAQFMELHCTGYIDAQVYAGYGDIRSFRWLGPPSRRPRLRGVVKTSHGDVELRQSDRRLVYVARNAAGETLRNAQGLAIHMSEQEAAARCLPLYDEVIVAFLGEIPIGYVSNDWGAVGAWVAERYQRCGIGTQLVHLHLQARPAAQLGRMTSAGMVLARAVHRSFLRGEPSA